MTLQTIRRAGARPYPPRVSEFTAIFWETLAKGRLVTSRGKTSGRLSFPPKPFCPFSWEREVEWAELSGRGILYSHTVVHAAPGVFTHLAPYRVCIVDLEEGLRVAGALICTDEPVIDAGVEAAALLHDDGPLLGFVQ
ncbi:MAG TPA: OB-fold domain-containing protein [Alphaproteobacteria bacterium]|nr:OB-fold domain-containing protein [Alphaproteobacteria bacterium]